MLIAEIPLAREEGTEETGSKLGVRGLYINKRYRSALLKYEEVVIKY